MDPTTEPCDYCSQYVDVPATSSRKGQALPPGHSQRSVALQYTAPNKKTSSNKKQAEIYGKYIISEVLLLKLFTGVHSNQDLIWCVKTGVYMGFWVHRGF